MPNSLYVSQTSFSSYLKQNCSACAKKEKSFADSLVYAYNKTMTTETVCEHISKSKIVKAKTPEGCEECLQMGAEWVHLRLCLSCGHVGCCDQSPNTHATKHFHKTKHPVIKSFQPGEDWDYCYLDELFYQP